MSVDSVAFGQFLDRVPGNEDIVLAHEVRHRVVISSGDFDVVSWHWILLCWSLLHNRFPTDRMQTDSASHLEEERIDRNADRLGVIDAQQRVRRPVCIPLIDDAVRKIRFLRRVVR